MTIILDLPKSVEHNIKEQAKRRGIAAADYAVDVLRQDAERTRHEKKQRALAAMERWKNITPEQSAKNEQAWEYLRKALDEDRLSPNRPLFPEGSSL